MHIIEVNFLYWVCTTYFSIFQLPCNSSGTLSNNSQKSSPGFYIIKVTYETDSVETDGIVLYKSIMLSNNERTTQVIRNAMYKLGLEGNPDQYTLAQVLPDKGKILLSIPIQVMKLSFKSTLWSKLQFHTFNSNNFLTVATMHFIFWRTCRLSYYHWDV